MKKWLVVVLVLLALLVLIAPGIVGQLAERNIAENIEWAETDNAGVTIETERFDRGWFTSAGTHRIVIDGTRFRDAGSQLADGGDTEELPSLLINTELSHGPLPGGRPGLATSVSTFQIDLGDGELIDLPGQLTSRVGLTGTTDSQLLIEGGSVEEGGDALSWEGADMKIQSNPATGAFIVNGVLKPWKLSSEDGDIEFGAMDVAADQTRSDYGFTVGTVNVLMNDIVLADPGSSMTIGGARFDVESGIVGDRASGSSRFALEDVAVPGFGEMGFVMDFTLADVDARAMGQITSAIDDAESSPDPQMALANIYSTIESDLQTLVQRGFTLDVNQFDINLPQGVVASTLSIDVPESDSGSFNWGSALLNMSGNLDLRIPAEVYQMAAMMSPEAASLVSMGFLKQEGDNFVMQAEYAQGLVNVNGLPMPIPMPGMQ